MKTLRIACACVFLCASLAAADDIWDRESKSWERKDADRILSNSPWGRSIPTKIEMVKDENKSVERSSRVNDNDRGDPREGDFARVWWWSAHTTRRAFLRVYELSGGKVSKESADEFAESKAEAYLVSIMGGGAMVTISGRLEPEELKKAAWIHSPRLDKDVPAENVQVVMAGGKPDRILFMFPKEVDGKPLITDEDKRVVFRFKLPKTPKESLNDAKTFETAFEPKKMTARGEADY